ncbi:MAG: right-handed parallel beta-helix repeat-containing protein [bacterium]
MLYQYIKINLIEKESFVFDGQNTIIDGEGQYAHLLNIHNCKNLLVKNFTFRNGDTNIVKYLSRKDITFRLPKMSVFEVIDGGAVLITGNSTVTFENCHFENNRALMCGGAISNQSSGKVLLNNCSFVGNIAGHTGSAIDNLTRNSQISIKNCKFIDNQSNSWHKAQAPHGHITVFPNTFAKIAHSTFKGGSLPLDYVDKANIKLENNKYFGFKDWQSILKNKRNGGIFFNYLNFVSKLYWLVPKTLGKVYYRVNA